MKEEFHGAADGNPTKKDSPHPRFIGHYRIASVLGSGGMGVVYEAEQQQPKRPVALKVVRGDRFVDEHYVRLFHREAQTLARLKHPGIAAIYEAGRTEDGQHFFAMELVRGDTLKAYVHHNGLDRSARLRLFRKICEPISYAHQRAVIHRDLKPSNILIDATGNPKILDFGLAKITDEDIAATTLITDVGRVQGTLVYMSPEQARGNPDEIDLRSDVYSLGVMLYELLTDYLPYDVGHRALHETVRIICEVPARGPRLLDRSLNRDLETIVLKTLAKEPVRRYQSAAALGEDIDRYLGRQPILARPPSALYQLQKLTGRHKVGFAMLLGLFLTVMGFGFWMKHLYHNEQGLRQRAEKVEEFLVNLFDEANPEVRQGGETSARDLLERGAKKIQTQEPESQLVFLPVIAQAFLNQGEGKRAADMCELELQIRQRTQEPEHPETVEALYRLGWAQKEDSDYEEAKKNLRRALELQRKNRRTDFAAIANTELVYAIALLQSGELTEARQLVEEVLARRNQWPVNELPLLSEFFQARGRVLYEFGEYGKAEEAMQEALRIRQKALSEDHPHLADVFERMVLVLQAKGRYVEAWSSVDRARTILRDKKYDDEHPYVASLNRWYGELRRDQGHAVEAERLLKDGLVALERGRRADHWWLAAPRTTLAWLALERGDLAGAAQQFRDVLSTYESPKGDRRSIVRSAKLGLAEVYLARNEFPEAEKLLQERLQDAELQKTWQSACAEVALARCLGQQGQSPKADRHATAGYEKMRALRGAGDRYVVEAVHRIAELWMGCGEAAKADQWRSKLPASNAP